MLDNVVRECLQVSRSYGGIPSPTAKHFYASLLFTMMCSRGVSMAILAPCSPWAAKMVEHWDYGSVTGIARTLLELRLAFYYLCVEAVSEDEWNARWNVFNLHDCTSRIRLFRALEQVHAEPQDEQIAGFTEQAEELRERLRTNPFFQSLSEKKQKRLLAGEQAYILPLEDIAVGAGVGKETYRYFNILLSSHIHALPMSFYRMDDGRGRGLPHPVEEGYTAMCLTLASALLTASRDDLRELFKDIAK